VTRIYDRAQTPLQRLLAIKILSADSERLLTALFQALDPVLLLRQLETLQEALWQHAIVGALAAASTCSGIPVAAIRFDPERCGLEQTPGDALVTVAPQRHQKRLYRRAKPRVPRTYRTRPDPFAAVWEEICKQLEMAPQQTAKALFAELQERHPGQYPDGQLRTLQRRVKTWRTQAIVEFDREWLDNDLLGARSLPGPLRAKVYAAGSL
jgi:hypothetical protein